MIKGELSLTATDLSSWLRDSAEEYRGMVADVVETEAKEAVSEISQRLRAAATSLDAPVEFQRDVRKLGSKVTMERLKEGKKDTVVIGFNDEIGESGAPLESIGRQLEFGDGVTDSVPIWNPAMRRLSSRLTQHGLLPR